MVKREILEAAKEVLLERDYVFSSWKSLRIALGVRKGIYGDKKVLEDRCCRRNWKVWVFSGFGPFLSPPPRPQKA